MSQYSDMLKSNRGRSVKKIKLQKRMQINSQKGEDSNDMSGFTSYGNSGEQIVDYSLVWVIGEKRKNKRRLLPKKNQKSGFTNNNSTVY